MNKPLVGGVFIMILSIVLAVIMMALNGQRDRKKKTTNRDDRGSGLRM
jgi:hypothetical protein